MITEFYRIQELLDQCDVNEMSEVDLTHWLLCRCLHRMSIDRNFETIYAVNAEMRRRDVMIGNEGYYGYARYL